MKVKTNILNGVALDWAVACVEELSPFDHRKISDDCIITLDNGDIEKFTPSTDWAQAGPIIERELLTLDYNPLTPHGRPWIATTRGGAEEYGATPLIAAMRAYVSSTFGDDVDIPEDLL